MDEKAGGWGGGEKIIRRTREIHMGRGAEKCANFQTKTEKTDELND